MDARRGIPDLIADRVLSHPLLSRLATYHPEDGDAFPLRVAFTSGGAVVDVSGLKIGDVQVRAKGSRFLLADALDGDVIDIVGAGRFRVVETEPQGGYVVLTLSGPIA